MRKQMYGIGICLVTVIFLTLTLISGPTQAHPSRRLAAPSATTPCATGITPVPIQHVVVIMEANQPYGNVIGSSNAPFTNALVKGGSGTGYSINAANACGLATNFHNTSHRNGAWGPKINPGPLDTAVTNGTLPAFSWITPNKCDDVHTPSISGCSSTNGVKASDNWLAAWVPFILSGPNYQAGNTELVISWDEDEGSDYKTGENCWSVTTTTNVSCHVATVFVGPNVLHTSSSLAVNQLDLLSRITSILGVTTLPESSSTGVPDGNSIQTTFGW